MDHRSFNFWRQVACCCVLVALTVVFGCTNSSLRELPFLRSADKSKASFEETLANSNSVSLTIWHDSFESARQASHETGKPILVDFTGSDWCAWCIKLRTDVFETAEFKAWARDNVILLELDYPKRRMQSLEIRKQNKELAIRYNVTVYPSVLFLDGDGEVLGKLGYMKDPADWISAATPLLQRQNRISEFRQ